MAKRSLAFIFLLILGYGFFIEAKVIAQDKPKGNTNNKAMCGPVSLQILLELLGNEVPLDKINRLSGFDEKMGTTMYGLADAAHKLGFNAVGMKLSINDLNDLKQPVIAFVNGNHFLVIDKIVDGQLRLIDPSSSFSLMSKDDFSKIWNGQILAVTKTKFIGGEQPHIQFDELIHDFGDAPQQGTVVHKFNFKNVGKTNLVISKVKASCACTAVLLSNKIIPPNGNGTIEFKFPTELWRGKRIVDAQVYSNDPDKPVVILSLTGNIAGWIPVVPNYLDFGDINGIDEIKKKVEIFDPGDGKLKVKVAKTSSPYLVADIISQNKERAEIQITLKSGMALGKFQEKMIVYTNNAKTPEVEVIIRGNARGSIRIFPNQFFFGSLSEGQTVSRNINIINEGQDMLEILKIEKFSRSILTEMVPVNHGKKYLIKATYTANGKKGVFKDVVKVYTNNPNQPLIEVPFYAVIQ